MIRLAAIGALALAARAATDAELDRAFTQTIRPFLASYCVACHSGANSPGQLDLRSYSTIASVIHDYPRWNTVTEKLAAEAMPPKGLKQPSAADRRAVIDWVHAVRANEIAKHSGDPGPVLAHRLSNAEYNYTIRDLTGADLRPAREFPVDPANPAGFDNSGESLIKSPALLNKYLQAARQVADHMVLTTTGFSFAPSPMLVETDRETWAIKRIVDFYRRQPTDYAAYFEAAWRYKHRAPLGNPRATLATAAAEAKVSPKYLPLIWELLEDPKSEVGPAGKLQSMWRALPAPGGDPKELRARCVEMRDFAMRIRAHTAMQFAAPVVPGLPAGSQPLLNWKLRTFSLHHRDSDPKALRNDTDPPPVEPVIPRYAGLHQEAAPRWAALMAKARMNDTDLIVPAADRARYEAAFERFANVFPDVFYVKERGRYWPDDSQDKGRLLSASYHNVMGYYRDDTALMELILDDRGQAELNRLWDEFDFVGDHTARTWVQYYDNQSGEVQGKGAESGTLRPEGKAVTSPEVIFGLRDAYVAKAARAKDPEALKAIEYHFQWENDTLRRIERLRVEAEPKHVEALPDFAARAWRRPLAPAERDDILAYYRTLRDSGGLLHEDAVRDSIVRILMSPKFCYRLDTIEAGAKNGARPLSAYALASRLSYFLWSSMPDEALLAHAASGDLRKPAVLAAETHRMLQDDRARALAVEFGGNWLDFRRFEEHNAVDRERFPSFTNELRQAMFEEPIRFLDDVFRNGGGVLDLLYGNHTFVNPVLAKHYGMPEVAGGPDTWVRVDDARPYGRGGLLTMGVFLTQNAPGLRTSPVKRGYWVVRRVLGETIPPPPATVPELPRDEAASELPLRDMLAKHRANAACASCHARFDTVGLAYEGYGPVGERRSKDLAGRAVDISAVFPGGFPGSGPEGVQSFIREHRQQDFVDNISRKFLGYALSRSLQLSDDPLVDRMKSALAAGNYRFASLIDTIVTSPQFLNKAAQATPGGR
jgi:mono/diheme cytochrome c family protein